MNEKKSRRSGAGLGRKKQHYPCAGLLCDENREIISQFNQSLAMTEQEETEQILACLKKSSFRNLGEESDGCNVYHAAGR